MDVWASYLHHITVHFPIVLTFGLAAVGLYSLRRETPELQSVLRWGGLAAFALTTLAIVSGIIAAPGFFGGDGPAALRHHRDLALTTWVVVALGALGYNHGVLRDVRDWRTFAITMWCIAALAVVGTGHWGGAELHTDSIPW